MQPFTNEEFDLGHLTNKVIELRNYDITINFGYYFSKFMNTEILLKKLFPSLFACLQHIFTNKDFLLLLKLNQGKETQSRMLIH